MKVEQAFQVFPQPDGDDLIISLPPEIVELLQINENQVFEMVVEGDQLRLTPKKLA